MDAASTTEGLQTWHRVRRFLVWPLCVLMVGIHLLWGDEAYNPEGLVFAGLIACLAVAVVAYAPPRMLPATPVLLAYYYVAMARPTFSPPFLKGSQGPVLLSSHSYDIALAGGLGFGVMLFVASALVKRWGHRIGESVAGFLDPPEPYGPGHTYVARGSAALALAFYAFVKLRPTLIPPSISFAVTLFSSPAIPLGLLFWDAHQTKRPLARLIFWGVVTFAALLGASGGSLGEGMVPGLIAASLLWSVTGRVPISLMIIGISFFLIVNPAKHRYRALTWYQDRDISLSERFEAWADALTYTYSTQTDAAIDASVESTAYRTSTLPFVALVFETVPHGIPHAGPARWLELPLMFVPRILWPEKPSHTEAFNNDFTITFGLQTAQGVETTTLNLPSVGDGYWRLGWPGVFIEGLLLGIVAGLFQGATLRESRALLILAVGFTVSTQADKHVFHILASLPQYLFATGMILFVVRMLTIWLATPHESTVSRAPGAASAP